MKTQTRFPFWRSERGQTLVIVAVGMIALLVAVGFAVDTGVIYLYRIRLGQAVDAATLAAAVELPNVQGACARAVEYLVQNDYYVGGIDEFNYEIIFPASGSAPELRIQSSDLSDPNDPFSCGDVAVDAVHVGKHFRVGVAGSQDAPVAFMHLIGFNHVEVGFPGKAERADEFDVALVLDRSGSMRYDSCGKFRDIANLEGYTIYGCQNRYRPCNPIADAEDPMDYHRIRQMRNHGWQVSGDVDPSGTDVSLGDDASIYRQFETNGANYVALYFNIYPDQFINAHDTLTIDYSLDESNWNPITVIDGGYLHNEGENFRVPREGGWYFYGLMLMSDAWTDPYIRFRVEANGNHRISLDEVRLQSCLPAAGIDGLNAWVHYDQNWGSNEPSDFCSGDDSGLVPKIKPENVSSYACQMLSPAEARLSLLPMVLEDVHSEPIPILLQQPMYSVLKASDRFLQFLENRPGSGMYIDQVGVATFSGNAEAVLPLTTDFSLVRQQLYTIQAHGTTNLGGGIREGLNILSEGRETATHYMILLSDGVPNTFNTPYDDPHPPAGGSIYEVNAAGVMEYIAYQVGRARTDNVVIFTIGLGERIPIDGVRHHDVFDMDRYGITENWVTGEQLLQIIAAETDGDYYYAETVDDLNEIFERIANSIFVRLVE